MKTLRTRSLAVVSAVLALSSFAVSQNMSGTPSTSTSQSDANAQPRGEREAQRMVPARAELIKTVDAKKTQAGFPVEAKLAKSVQLQGSSELPAGTMLIGTVVQDDMQVNGQSKLALRFTGAQLKDGTMVPVKATIVGYFKQQSLSAEGYPIGAADEVPNNWNDGMLKVDQINAMSKVDLHSSVASRNSGVFVSRKNNGDVVLRSGSELQLAIAAGTLPMAE